MRYSITHCTTYEYQDDVNVSHHVARLEPRDLPGQACLSHELEIHPAPGSRERRTDPFGNHVTRFSIGGPYRELRVLARSVVEVLPGGASAEAGAAAGNAWAGPGWEEARAAVAGSRPGGGAWEAREFRHASAMVPRAPELAEYARPSFPAGRPLAEAVADLTARIHRDFTFDPTATTVATPVLRVFELRRGVCQDFAQLQIACLRSLGLAARYVSGYLETLPPPGMAKLVGADASHAWLSVYCPGAGWLDFDPTNNLRPSDRHVTVAWGLDFSDTSLLRGVFVGSGSQSLSVSVDVNRIE